MAGGGPTELWGKERLPAPTAEGPSDLEPQLSSWLPLSPRCCVQSQLWSPRREQVPEPLAALAGLWNNTGSCGMGVLTTA